jgi:hypothetical protein
MTDKQYLAIFEDDLAVLQKPVATVLVPDHPAGGDKSASFRSTTNWKGV